jgi:hypothetical protein
MTKYFSSQTRFDDVTAVHDQHSACNAGDHAQIVSDPNHRHPQVGLQLTDKVDDLLLDGDVESGGRLVCDEDPGSERQGDGDHDSLTHSP